MREGSLTPSQFEILCAIWPKGRCGASVGEIWQVVSEDRDVSRTTVLNQVQRLEDRGWLYRQSARENQPGNANRFVVSTGPKRAKMELANKILEDYFEGSISQFVLSYLGSKRPSSGRVDRLIEVLQNCDEDKLSKDDTKLAVHLLTCES
jgi:predicted transcriptional regulator